MNTIIFLYVNYLMTVDQNVYRDIILPDTILNDTKKECIDNTKQVHHFVNNYYKSDDTTS